METPTRLTSTGPVGGPNRESLTGRDPSSGSSTTGSGGGAPEAAQGPAQGDPAPATGAELSEEAKGLLDRADILIHRFSDLSGSLSDLADYLPEGRAGTAAQMQERVRWMIDDLRQIKGEIREDGPRGVYEDVIDDYSDIAQTIAARAQSLRSVGAGSSSEPSEGTPSGGTGLGQLGAGEEEDGSGSGGPAATTLMVVGGAALTAWVLFRGSGSGQDTGQATGGQATGGRQSPGEVVPAGGALIGQH